MTRMMFFYKSEEITNCYDYMKKEQIKEIWQRKIAFLQRENGEWFMRAWTVNGYLMNSAAS